MRKSKKKSHAAVAAPVAGKPYYTTQAKEDLAWWRKHNPKVLARIEALIADIRRSPFVGLGKPEPLKHEWQGYWFRRISEEHRARHHHCVYVVLLSNDVLDDPKFKRCNPDYDQAKPCVYVGMTGFSPDDRFDKHKAGIKSNKFVRLYGMRLMPELYECYNPMPYDAAKDMEVELAIGLREDGYGVWQG